MDAVKFQNGIDKRNVSLPVRFSHSFSLSLSFLFFLSLSCSSADTFFIIVDGVRFATPMRLSPCEISSCPSDKRFFIYLPIEIYRIKNYRKYASVYGPAVS